MVDIFDEVNEDLRAERMRGFARRYGLIAAAALLAVVLAVGGWQGWRAYQSRQAASVATSFVAAMTRADLATESGTPAPDVAASLSQAFAPIAAGRAPGYRAMARLREAALLADAGDLAGATRLWAAVAGDKSSDKLLRDLAVLLWARNQVGSGDADVLTSRLKTIATPENPWRPLADETLALIALRAGSIDAAKQILRPLARDVTAPDSVRGRATTLLTRLGEPPPPADTAQQPRAGG